MKHITKGVGMKALLTFLTIAFLQTIIVAQDNGSSASGSSTTSKSVSVTSQSSNWLSSPWLWVAGAVVFILLLVALLRGRGDSATSATRTERVTVTKSTSGDVV